MQRTSQSREIFVLLLSSVGIAALFLPFAHDVSPWLVLSEWTKSLPVGYLAAPLLLAAPILAWQTRRLLANQLSVLELTTAYMLSAAAMISVLALTAFVVLDKGVGPDVVPISLCWALAGANVVLLWRNLAMPVPRDAAAEAFLLGA